MKRDFELIREILLKIEAMPEGGLLSLATLSLPPHEPSEVSGHIQLLADARLIEASISKEIGPVTARGFHVYRMTWEGHEFLDTLRDPDVWAKTKAAALTKGSSMTFDILKAIATAFIKQKFGLP